MLTHFVGCTCLKLLQNVFQNKTRFKNIKYNSKLVKYRRNLKSYKTCAKQYCIFNWQIRKIQFVLKTQVSREKET